MGWIIINSCEAEKPEMKEATPYEGVLYVPFIADDRIRHTDNVNVEYGNYEYWGATNGKVSVADKSKRGVLVSMPFNVCNHSVDWDKTGVERTGRSELLGAGDGHSMGNRNYDVIAADYDRRPVKPVIDGEPGYENITNGLKAPGPDVPLLSASDVRRFAYCAVFAGAAGHTYGCNEVYQFWVPGNRTPRWGAKITWREAIELPGSSQMQYLRNLVESRPMVIRIPDQSILEEIS
jgi:hypothetical protein